MTLSLTDKGFDYVAYYNGAYEDANSLQSLAGTGANSVELSLEYGIDPQTNTVYADPSYTDSLAALGTEIRQATGLGLSAMVRPLIDFVNPADMTGTPYSVDDWRSYYNPGPAGSAGANAFFASYQTMILQEAQVAAANGATSLSIGTELDQITGPAYQGYWDSIVTALRTDDPGLKLTYSADWDDDLSPWQWGGTGLAAGTGNLATQVSFAGELDSIGIDEYAPISDAADPTLAQLIAGWTQTPTDPTTSAVTGKQSLISYFESVAAQIGKPLLFTELGYENASDAAEQPAYTSTGVVDSNLQAQLYQAFFEAWSQAGNSSLTGVYFWNWDPNAAEVGPGNGVNFSPQGLPAQTVATDWFTPPAAPSGLTLSPASDSGTKGDDITNVTKPTITGTGEAGDTVTLLDGSTTIGTAKVGTNGGWSIIPSSALAAGKNVLTATETETDVADNASGASTALNLTIKTSAPAPSGLTLSPGSDSGAKGDDVTNVTKPTITGTSETGDTVTLRDRGKSIGTATVGPNGGWSITPASALANGMNVLTATEVDVAGNTSKASSALDLTIKTSAPAVTEKLVTPGRDLITASPDLKGAGAANATVTITENSVVLGTATAGSTGKWTFNPVGLAAGTHTLVASETDVAGNTGTATLNFVLQPVGGATLHPAASKTVAGGTNTTIFAAHGDTVQGGTSGIVDLTGLTLATGGALLRDTGSVLTDTVVGFTEGVDHLNYAGETATNETNVVATANLVNGNTVLSYSDGSKITLFGVTHVDTGIFA